MIEKIKFFIAPSNIKTSLAFFNEWLHCKFSFLNDPNLISAFVFCIYFFMVSFLIGYIMSGRIFFIFKTVWLYLLGAVYLGIYIALKYYSGNFLIYFLCLIVFLSVTFIVKVEINEKLIQNNIDAIVDEILDANNKNTKI